MLTLKLVPSLKLRRHANSIGAPVSLKWRHKTSAHLWQTITWILDKIIQKEFIACFLGQIHGRKLFSKGKKGGQSNNGYRTQRHEDGCNEWSKLSAYSKTDSGEVVAK